jgi:hypothetical protein
MIDMMFVDSASVEALGYDAPARELHVRFVKSGETYIYEGVEESVFEDFKRADSKGVFLNTNIKDHYGYRKL